MIGFLSEGSSSLCLLSFFEDYSLLCKNIVFSENVYFSHVVLYLFLSSLGLHCFCLSCSKWGGYSLVVGCRPLTVASLIAERGL